MEGNKYHTIIWEKLYDMHFEIWAENTEISNSARHADISIQYAINVLEGMQPQHSEPDTYIQSEIDRLKSLLKQ